ncbi:MAG: HDOD domain-containing protein [Thermodesulfobacteriota bacterium]
MSQIEAILKRVDSIPPFPRVARRIMEMLDNPDVTVPELAKVVEFDQAITANVLRMCNSAYVGLARKVSSLEEALVLLGQDTLREIIVAGSCARFFQASTGGYDLDEGELWQHSVACGIMAKVLIAEIPGVDGNAAYTAALLHDIGKTVLSSFVQQEFRAIMIRVLRDKVSFVSAELEVLGINHAELGGVILERWKLPHEVVEAVRRHHDLDVLAGEPLSALVALANALVVSMGIGVGADGLTGHIQGEGLGRFALTEERLDISMAELVARLAQAKEFFALE